MGGTNIDAMGDNPPCQYASADLALPDAPKDLRVDALSRRRAWARLLANVHELNVMAGPRCASRMSVIVDPAKIRKIIA